MHRLSGFAGTKALIAKILFMAAVDALLVWMFLAAVSKHSGVIQLVIALIFLIVNYVYFGKKPVPFKFLTPGLILMVLFILVPVIYTVTMSLFNFQTGNEVSKKDAITALLANGLTPDPNNTTYDMVLGVKDGQMTALLTNPATKQSFVGNAQSVVALPAGSFTEAANGDAIGLTGFKAYTPDQAANLGDQINALKLPLPNGAGLIEPQTETSASLLTEEYKYDAAANTLTNNSTGQVYKDNGNGNFALTTDPNTKLFPGWKAYTGFSNYLHLLDNPAVRGPFIGVFIWTFCFSIITVAMMFFVGLLLAITLDQKIGLKRFYRSILILPYAIPSLMSILIWRGMFQTQYGAVNSLFHTHIDFMDSPWFAKGIVLVVNLWLGFPYFYLICAGALQAVPAELSEAAAIDGAKPAQILRNIKLPLVLQILSPLLIASFAFNFNNFNLIYLLTGGGPTDVLHGKFAGATDILITYTYKTAFNGNHQDFGMASAISMVIFILIGLVSLWSIRRANVLDNN